jgi:enamine deaminase RidA (YjgF/YER057c/UK114 family)
VAVGVRVDQTRVEQHAAGVDRHGAGRGGQTRRADLADGVADDQNVAGIGAVRARVEQATTADDRERAGLDGHGAPRQETMWQYTRGHTNREEASMKRQNIQPDKLAKRVVGGHTLYSHVVVVEARKTIFVAGQLARDAQGNVVGKGDMRAQIRQTGENIKTALAAAGATLNDIVKTNTYVTNIEEFFKHTDVRMEYFGAMPTSTTIEVSKLAHPDLMVEIEVIAMVD